MTKRSMANRLIGSGNITGKRASGAYFAAIPSILIVLSGSTGTDPTALAQQGPGNLKLLSITPSGNDVPAGRQIVFEFDRPVAPLGRMERSQSEVPISIDPPLSCQWRWLRPSSLACQLEDRNAIAPATRYTLTVGPGFKAEDGPVMSGKITHGFTTQRAKVGSAYFRRWLSPVLPRFSVRFNQPVRGESIEAHLFFQVDGGPRVGAKAVEDEESGEKTPNLVWLVSPSVDLPPDAACRFAVEPGILSMLGKEPGIDNRGLSNFHTFPEFRFMGVQCGNLSGAQITIIPGDARSSKFFMK